LRLEIHDDGCGIADRKVADATSLGLLGMKERVHSYGGSVEIRGAPACGTTVDVSIPLAEPPTP
jgi:signal transduction histidine kinase